MHLRLVAEVPDQFAERHRRSVGSGSDQSSQNGLAEAWFSSSGEELEELAHKKPVSETMLYLLSREDVDKDSCFSCPSWTCFEFCLFCTNRCPKYVHIQSVNQRTCKADEPAELILGSAPPITPATYHSSLCLYLY